jgi:uncharacterized membrane protein YbaN (DUF454 family)
MFSMKACDCGQWTSKRISVALISLINSPAGIIIQLFAMVVFAIFARSAWYNTHVWMVEHQYIEKPIECINTNNPICSDESIADAFCILECILAVALLIASLFIRIAYLCIKLVIVMTMEDLERDLKNYDENAI